MAKPAEQAASPIPQHAPLASTLPRGGAWDNQINFGGLRMDQVFTESEVFILWGLAIGPKVKTDLGEPTKTILDVSRLTKPDERFEVGTLSTPIAAMAELAIASDFPVEAFWKQVPTDLSPAVVLEAVRPWEDPAND